MKPFGFDRFTALLTVLAALASGLVLLRTNNYGAAIAGDSLLYLSVAENLLDGNGFVEWHTKRIYLDGAPLFPLALAGVGLFGVEVLEVARHLNAAAFGLTVFVTALWLRCRVAPHFLVLWSACACALSVFLSTSAASIMTEPLFLLFTTLSLFTLDGFLDTRRRSFLLAAAASAALAWLTRYIGVTLVASALLLLLLQGRTAFPTRIRYAALYAIIAGAPMGLWMLRNVLHAGMPLGVAYPTGFSLLSSLHVASDEFIRWVIGENASRLLGARPAEIVAGVIEGDEIVFMSLKVGFLLAVASGVSYALIRLRRRGYAQSWSIWAVPITFASAYALFLMVQLPLTDVNLPARYLAPLYVPLLVAATLFLNEVLSCAAHARPLAKSHFLRKWKGGETATASWSHICLVACLSLWLFSHSYANYSNIRHWVDNGLGHASKRWRNSSAIRYVENHLRDEYVWSNGVTSIQFLEDAPGWTNKLPYARPTPDNLRRWLGEGAWITRIEPYLVWFRRMKDPRYDYGPAELAALPGVQIAAVLEDGYIFKAGPQHANNVESRDLPTSLETALKGAGRSVIDSEFDVYLDKRKNTLIYVREDCRDDDLKTPVFLHVFPMQRTDLPDHRRLFTFDNLDFSFGERTLRLDGRCIAARGLPDYPVARIHTGQWIPGKGRIWEGEVNLVTLIVDIIENTQPVIRADFDVYLDENRNQLIYVREDCRDTDLEALGFLQVFPMQKADLPGHRQPFAYDNLDFSFGERAFRLDGRCIAARGLPDYPVARIRTGQWIPGKGQIWKGEATLDFSIADIIENTQPVIHSDFDIYLDENRNRLIYVREDCRDDDLETPVFLHVFPMQRANLPDHRQPFAYDNLDFSFGERAFRLDGRCIAARGLPDYPVARIRTGQGVAGKGHIWEGEVDSVASIVDIPATSIGDIIENTQPVIRADFDVYLDENENRLIYVREDCRDDDLEALGFLHVFPTQRTDLPDHRRPFTYDNLDFSFGEQAFRLDGRCIAVRGLPDYPVAHIRTGQWIPGKGRIWKGEATLDFSIADIMENTQPVIRADFDVYLDENQNRLIYVREGCRDTDLETPAVFLHVFPTQRTDLPDHRRPFTYDNLDFSFGERALRLDGRCIAVRGLPDHPVARIRTGQHLRGQGNLWTSEFSLD